MGAVLTVLDNALDMLTYAVVKRNGTDQLVSYRPRKATASFGGTSSLAVFLGAVLFCSADKTQRCSLYFTCETVFLHEL